MRILIKKWAKNKLLFWRYELQVFKKYSFLNLGTSDPSFEVNSSNIMWIVKMFSTFFRKTVCQINFSYNMELHAFFYYQRFFSTQLLCCLTFPWIQLQMLLRLCLLHITVIILRHILYLVYLCPCLGLVLFISYLCGLFFIFSLSFIIINQTISLKQTHLFFAHFLEYLILVLDDNMNEESA